MTRTAGQLGGEGGVATATISETIGLAAPASLLVRVEEHRITKYARWAFIHFESLGCPPPLVGWGLRLRVAGVHGDGIGHSLVGSLSGVDGIIANKAATSLTSSRAMHRAHADHNVGTLHPVLGDFVC